MALQHAYSQQDHEQRAVCWLWGAGSSSAPSLAHREHCLRCSTCCKSTSKSRVIRGMQDAKGTSTPSADKAFTGDEKKREEIQFTVDLLSLCSGGTSSRRLTDISDNTLLADWLWTSTATALPQESQESHETGFKLQVVLCGVRNWTQ